MAKVFLSAGHGGYDPGAVGYGMEEKEVNLNILLKCKEELIRHGVDVVCSRMTDENDPVEDEVAEANASGADIAVSFHTNAGGGDGSESYFWTSSEEGRKLATLCELYTQGIGQNSRGIKNGNGLYFVNGTSMPAVLCECAFIDNDRDNWIIDTIPEQEAFGEAYAKAILEYFGIAYQDAKSSKKKETKKESKKVDDSFLVHIDIDCLNIRKGPGTNYEKVGQFTGVGAFTIVEVSNGEGSDSGWGLLKAFENNRDGWISLDYAERI